MNFNIGEIVLVSDKYLGEITNTSTIGIYVDILGKGECLCSKEQIKRVDLRKLLVDVDTK